MQTVIEVSDLTKQFGEQTVLNQVDLTVKQGEIFGFVGRNGAGKSTFIHILTGIIHPTSGNFKILGMDQTELDQIKASIGVMPDVANLYDHMRGEDFLRYMGELAGDQRPKSDYHALLASVGLADAGTKKIKAYSFGMKKKICIAQALLGQPKLIFLDEPTSGVDPESAIHLRQLIANLRDAGKTIFLTSHNLDEIERISDRVAILNDGVIKRVGAPNKLKVKKEKTIDVTVVTQPLLEKATLKAMAEKYDLQVSWQGVIQDKVSLRMKEFEDIPQLSHALIQENYALYTLTHAEQSLEEVFMNA